MTGRELIALIQDCHAEDMQVVVQYRDAGGTYPGGETVGGLQGESYPCLAHITPSRVYDDASVEITYRGGLTPNAIVL